MSSILKALKKLEDEKAAKQGQRVDITRDIFGAAQQPTTGIRWPLIAAGAAGIVALGAVAYLFVTKPGTRPTPPPVSTETRKSASVPYPAPAVEPRPAVPQVPQETRTAPPKPAPPRAVPPTAPKAVASRPKTPAPSRARPAQVTTAPRATVPSTTPVISANHPAITTPHLTPQQGKPSPPTGTSSSVMAPAQTPTVTVSGIAYNTTPADRLAVINGVPVGEGKSISGVKVEEILPDKVRFSQGQKTFEVPVGRSNQ